MSEENLIWEAFEKSRIERLYDYGYRPHPTKEGVVVLYSNSKFGEEPGGRKEFESPDLYRVLQRYEMFKRHKNIRVPADHRSGGINEGS